MGSESSRVLRCSRHTVTPFFSACLASSFSPFTQLVKASSGVMAPDFGSSGLVHLYPTNAMTLGNFASAQRSMVLLVRSMTSSWNLVLLNPRVNGAPGIPLEAMAQVRLFFLSMGQCSGPMSSTDLHPSSFVTSQTFSADHFSPRALKHQNATDC